jgi:hypothetical protein
MRFVSLVHRVGMTIFVGTLMIGAVGGTAFATGKDWGAGNAWLEACTSR